MTDIVDRLRGYNPPDRTVDEQRQIAIDIHEAADEIEWLRKDVDKTYLMVIRCLRGEIEQMREFRTLVSDLVKSDVLPMDIKIVNIQKAVERSYKGWDNTKKEDK